MSQLAAMIVSGVVVGVLVKSLTKKKADPPPAAVKVTNPDPWTGSSVVVQLPPASPAFNGVTGPVFTTVPMEDPEDVPH